MNLHLLVLKADRYFGERQWVYTPYLLADKPAEVEHKSMSCMPRGGDEG
jgi:hypothetical protein